MAQCKTGSASIGFEAPVLNASICEFKFKLPSFDFHFQLPEIPFPPKLLFDFHFSLKLSCSLDNPIDLSAGLDALGIRLPCGDVDVDLLDL